jgi:hypothetical protein
MSTLELKHIITEYISNIEDISFLNELKTIIESKVSENIYILSDYQKKQIELSRQELKNGQTITHEDLQKEIDQWLSTK